MGKDFYFHINPLLHDAFPYIYNRKMYVLCLFRFYIFLADTVEMEEDIYVFRCLWKMSHKKGLVIMQNKMYFKLNCVCLPKDKRKK